MLQIGFGEEALFYGVFAPNLVPPLARRPVHVGVEPRAQEVLALVRDELRRGGVENQIPAGLVFTGGGAKLHGLCELAEKFFNLPVRVAVPRGLEGMSEEVSQPEYATAVGLVLYGARTRRSSGARPNGWVGKLKSMFAGA